MGHYFLDTQYVLLLFTVLEIIEVFEFNPEEARIQPFSLAVIPGKNMNNIYRNIYFLFWFLVEGKGIKNVTEKRGREIKKIKRKGCLCDSFAELLIGFSCENSCTNANPFLSFFLWCIQSPTSQPQVDN